MLDLNTLQKEIYKNKLEKGFDVSNIEKQFCFLHEEISEAYSAYRKKLPDLGEELADVAIFLFGLSEILDIDLEKEISKKIEKNKKREYKTIHGVVTRIKDA